MLHLYHYNTHAYIHALFYFGEFKRGRTSIEDESGSGTPDLPMGTMCYKIRTLIYCNKRIQVEEITTTFDISYCSALTIL